MNNLRIKVGLSLGIVLLVNLLVQRQLQANPTENTVIQLVNQARSQSRICGDQRFSSTNPLSKNSKLSSAASSHSQSQASRQIMTHSGSNRSTATLGKRATMAGYQWRNLAENVARGQTSPQAVVQSWLNSPGHCKNIMQPYFKDVGVGAVQGNDGKIYWTMVFGRT